MQCRWCSRSQSRWIRKKETSPIFQPSKIVAGQQKQNANNDEDEFKNIFPWTENIQLPYVSLQSAENVQASYIILEATKTNPAVAEILAVQVMEVKLFANFVINVCVREEGVNLFFCLKDKKI